jgi:hypothetical protein
VGEVIKMEVLTKQEEYISEKQIVDAVNKYVPKGLCTFDLGNQQVYLCSDKEKYLKLLCSDEELLNRIKTYVEKVALNKGIVDPNVMDREFYITYLLNSESFPKCMMYTNEWHINPDDRFNQLVSDPNCENVGKVYRQNNDFSRNYGTVKKLKMGLF